MEGAAVTVFNSVVCDEVELYWQRVKSIKFAFKIKIIFFP